MKKGNTMIIRYFLRLLLTLIMMLTVFGCAGAPIEKNTDVIDLMIASQAGKIKIVQALLDKGVDVNVKGHSGTTALMYASREGRKEIVELLLGKGADVNAKMKDRSTALMFASMKGHKEIQELLTMAGAE